MGHIEEKEHNCTIILRDSETGKEYKIDIQTRLRMFGDGLTLEIE